MIMLAGSHADRLACTYRLGTAAADLGGVQQHASVGGGDAVPQQGIIPGGLAGPGTRHVGAQPQLPPVAA